MYEVFFAKGRFNWDGIREYSLRVCCCRSVVQGLRCYRLMVCFVSGIGSMAESIAISRKTSQCFCPLLRSIFYLG